MIFETFWGLLLKGSLLVLLAAICAIGLQRTSASRRHVLWLATLFGLLLLPIAQVRLPEWSVSPQTHVVVTPLVVPAPIEKAVAANTPPDFRKLMPQPTKAGTAPQKHPFNVPAMLIRAWLIGGLAVLALPLLGLARIRAMVRGAQPYLGAKVEWPLIRGRSIPVLTTAQVRVPAMTGIVRPKILLPEDAIDWPSEKLKMAVAHEAAHAQRRDPLWGLVARFVCAAYWFNPLSWYAASRLRAESEAACDDFVLAAGIEPTGYAQELLEIAKRVRFEPAPLLGMARTRRVGKRVLSIVDSHRNRKRASGKTVVGALIVTLLVVAPLAVLRPALARAAQQHGFQKFAIPEIPHTRSEEVAPGVFLARNGVAGLANGVDVRLVGLSSAMAEGTLWNLQKGPVSDPEPWTIGFYNSGDTTFHRWSHGKPMMSPFGRGFIVEVESRDPEDIGFTSRIVDPPLQNEDQRLNPEYAGWDDRIPDLKLDPNAPKFSIIELGVPVAQESGTFRVGIASGDWQQVAQLEVPFSVEEGQIKQDGPGAHCGISLDQEPKIFYRGMNGQLVQQPIVSEKPLSDNTARRIVAYDLSGNIVDLGNQQSFDVNGYQHIEVPAGTFCKIARVDLYACDYQWAEFRDVPLRPHLEEEEERRLASNVAGTAKGVAPGFAKTLSNGVTVSLLAVTKAIQDRDNWIFTGQPSWRGDGEVLAGRETFSDFHRPVSVWGKQPLTSFKLGYEGLNKGDSTFAEATTAANPAFWLQHSRPFECAMAPTLETSFVDGAKVGGIRVGVANGPWETIAERKISIPQRSTVLPESEPGEDRTGLEVTVGDQVDFKIFGKGSERLTSQPLGKVAKRVVAVLKNGQQLQLQMFASGDGTQIYDIPARHGEFTEGYNKIIASEVAAILVQTRPFEWADFSQIPLGHK